MECRLKNADVRAVQVRWVDFNPAITPWEKMFDGQPFAISDERDAEWVSDAIYQGKLEPHNTGGVDCAHWRVINDNGFQNAVPDDWIVRLGDDVLFVMNDAEFHRTYERKV